MASAQKLPKLVNGVNIGDFSNTVDAVKTTPSIAKFNFRIKNNWQGSSRNRSTVNGYYGAGQEHARKRSFLLESDEPAALLGSDVAPSPVEHLLHALAACVTTSMVYHAAARGIEIQGVESSFEGDIDLHGFLDLNPEVRKGYKAIRVNFKLKADAPDQKLQEIVELGTGHSPVFDSITNGVPVSVTVEPM